MQLKFVKSAVEAQDSMAKVGAIAWTPNNRRMAAAGQDRIVMLFDESGQKKEKFTTRPADTKGSKNYQIKSMVFSPDSTKLAVAQTDNIVFVYKLGIEWGEKKAISNKFPSSSAVTCLVWPTMHQQELVYGTGDGKVKVGHLRNNKSTTLYASDSFVVSMCSNVAGNAIVAGHLDGTLYVVSFENGISSATKQKFAKNPVVPFALAWASSVVVAGADRRVRFYNTDGRVAQQFDFSKDETEREHTVAAASPSGQSVVIGSYDRFRTFTFNARRDEWSEANVTDVPNLYTVTTIAWKRDGSRLAVGSLAGGVDLYDACIKRFRLKGKYELTYVSPSQVIVKKLSSGERLVLGSCHGFEILKVNVHADQFLVAHTQDTLLMGDMSSTLVSELSWQGSGNEKFFFENMKCAMVFNAGELTLVEYGSNEPLASVRTEFISPHLISVRLNERAKQLNSKRIAYLIDLQTIRVDDLTTGLSLATINHDVRIDWVSLNARGNWLLFRDKRRVLSLFNVDGHQQRTTLLNFCSYVQWVPGSDVVVAQNRTNLCVWYAIDKPENVTTFAIRGDVVDIEKSDTKTEVVIDEGVQSIYIALNEPLIQFGICVEDGNYDKAVEILERAEMTPEITAMWSSLSSLALSQGKLRVAERCCAALGDISRTKYLHRVNRIADNNKEEQGNDGTEYYMVRAMLHILNKNFAAAERMLLEQGQIEQAMEMYQDLHKWDESIRVGESKEHPSVENLKRNYYQWLLETGQEQKAAVLKEKQGDIHEAINLYLKGGLPMKAALLVQQRNVSESPELHERIANHLFLSGLFEKAGVFFEKLNLNERALDSYRKGRGYRAAVDLARSVFPERVVTLEEEWGEWLVSQKQVDGAINHFIQAGKYERAIEAAMDSGHFDKAKQIVDTLDLSEAKKFYKRIARHYEKTQSFDVAEKYYIKARLPEEAVEMYTKANLWDAAYKIAVTYMPESEVAVLLISQAQRLEAQSKYKDAEKLYLIVNEPDLAINMYKKARQYEHMITLVSTYHKDLLAETHLHLAQQLEAEGQFKQAEKHYCEANDWKAAVNMFRANDMWDEALRLAKQYGGVSASTQVTTVWARSLGGEAGMQLLLKFGLADQAIDFALELGMFQKAEDLAHANNKRKLSDVYLKHAMYLEDDQRFEEAEAEYIKAQKPKEAVYMFIHQQDWKNATRVAESHEPTAVNEVIEAQAKLFLQKKEYAKAEQFFVKARKAEQAVKMYKDASMIDDAIRVTKEHMHNRLVDVDDNDLIADDRNPAEVWKAHGEYSRAIDAYLKPTVDDTSDHDALEHQWEQAVELAMNYVPDRVDEVVTIVTKRLVALRRFEQAGDMLENIAEYKQALDVYIQGELWDNVDKLITTKAVEYASFANNTRVRVLAEKGDWKRCLEVAQDQGQDEVNKYAGMYAQTLIKDDQWVEAIGVFAEYGVAADKDYIPLYVAIGSELLRRASAVNFADSGVAELRQVMFELVPALKKNKTSIAAELIESCEKLLQCAHLMRQRSLAMAQQLDKAVARINTSLLRFVGMIPVDKAFYDAGMACKAAGEQHLAFVFLNRYLDVSEAMEEGDAGIIENADFENTDIPFDIQLPTKQTVTEQQREEVRSWLLQVSLEGSLSQAPPTRSCPQCASDVYVGSLFCPTCKSDFDSCPVTGYPVSGSTSECTHCHTKANREDSNQWLLKHKTCSWCSSVQSPSYS